jgi:hypothetical protein
MKRTIAAAIGINPRIGALLICHGNFNPMQLVLNYGRSLAVKAITSWMSGRVLNDADQIYAAAAGGHDDCHDGAH